MKNLFEAVKKTFLSASDFVEDAGFDDPHLAARAAMQRDAQRQDSSPEPATETASTAIVTVGNTGLDAQPVRGTWIDASALDSGDANRRTREFESVVNSFDEDRQDKLAWLIGKFFIVLAYLAPPVLGWYAGLALGDTLAGPFSFANNYSTFSHLISVTLELSVPMLGYAVNIAFKRAGKDRSQVPKCVAIVIAFVLLAAGNAVTQDILLYRALPQDTTYEILTVWFRSFGPSIVDIICTATISVVGAKNLKKYIADQREKIVATREVSLIHTEMDRATLQAGIDKQAALQDMQSKAKRATTWNRIEGMQADSMIEQAERNMRGDDTDTSGGRRSRYR